jgi:FtsP/CotA-like multicopper oxidase with cupredoxin domain
LTAVVGACSEAKPPDASAVNIGLDATPAQIDLGRVTVHTWAWGGQIPGKEIRLTKGQRLRADVTNNLPNGTTVHWHGLAIPNAMDGVPVLTQPEIAPGQRFQYEFVVGAFACGNAAGSGPVRAADHRGSRRAGGL